MDFISDFLWQVRPVFTGIYWLVMGKFLPASCTWCAPFFWLSEIAIVVLIVTYLRPQGPSSRN